MRTSSGILVTKRLPLVTMLVLVGCVAGFIVELGVGGRNRSEFVLNFGIVPTSVVAYFAKVEGATFANSLLPFFSSLFLHGGFLHLVTNLLYLWMVGELVENWLGRTRFLLLFLFGAVAELIVRIGVAADDSQIASVGISGAVAAVIVGYVVILVRLKGSHETQSTRAVILKRLPLILGALVWFPLQLINWFLPLAETCQTSEPVSWPAVAASALVGGFLLSLSSHRRGFPSIGATSPREGGPQDPPEQSSFDEHGF